MHKHFDSLPVKYYLCQRLMRGRGRGAEKGKCNSTSTVTPLPETTEMQTLWSLDSPSKFAMSDDCCYAKVGRKYTMKGT